MERAIGLLFALGLLAVVGVIRGGPGPAVGGLARSRPPHPTGDLACPGTREYGEEHGSTSRSPPDCDGGCRAGLPPCATIRATVLRVVDGDTVILRMNARPHRVRLIGVDAPETWLRHDCFGAEATRALRHLLPPGTPVRAAADAETRDHYGRLLLYLWTPRGAFVNATVVRDGDARTMLIPPNVGQATALRRAQRTAQQAKAGLWRACASP